MRIDLIPVGDNPPESLNVEPKKYSASRAASKVKRIIRTLPDYLKDA